MRSILNIFFLLFITSPVFSQGTTLKGFAPDFVGQIVNLYAYQDFITHSKIKIGEGQVNAKDSTFEIKLANKSTLKGVIEIENTEADLYLSENSNYTIYFPKSKQPISYNNNKTQLYFNDLDTLDINYLVMQYHDWFDSYIAYNEIAISRGQWGAYLDTFKTYAEEAYEEIDNIYFLTYVRYDIAEMEQSIPQNRSGKGKLKTYLNYIEPFPVYFENDRYMKYILGFYDKDFIDYSPETRKKIFEGINASSPKQLMAALQNDLFLARPEIREMIMLDKLGKTFYTDPVYKDNILRILDSVITYPTFKINSAIANNVRNYVTSLENGFPAPAINLQSDEEQITWAKYKGQYVYFNFFATWNDQAKAEMEVMEKLYRKYGADISFLSVCVDEKVSDFKQFKKENPTYDWDIVHIGDQKHLLEDYNVKGIPSYVMVDQEGFIHSAPALSPSPSGGEYMSINQTMFYIQKALHPTVKINVGGKE
ncbi:TlpA family protein disulfide reductase [Crocinitomix catalasitica]|uniref:TlpA family protein disulfide reductase n=1 Tax=Crocinitomix catalasitica TaxID=184607 RepID=UPI0004870D85|nr:TlpA disulfide reductase family protein [Crocinitomix catalasitica]